MNLVRGQQGGGRRQAARPVLSAYLILLHLLIGGGCRLQSATRTRPLGRPKLPRGRAALAAVVGFLTVALAGPAVSAPAHAATPVAAPAAGQTVSPRAAPAATECDSTATLGSDRASGCFDKDPRLGPTQLPTPGSSPPGSVTAAIAKITTGYQRFGNLPGPNKKETLLSPPPKGYWAPEPPRPGWKYPEYSGFALDKNKKPIHHSQMLMLGTFIDRFGRGTGTFLAPAGTPYAERALPPSSLDTEPVLGGKTYHYNYHLYKVVKPFTVEAGPIAPWFGQKGGGLQYVTCPLDSELKNCVNPPNPPDPKSTWCRVVMPPPEKTTTWCGVDDLVSQKYLTEQALPAK